ncbi:hypothetical protein DAI22_07g075400 [Oryza sativa Japonica Group]|nr:hypothetical protein DAI22_07g075400 [Oryza sativa Japonica Group]
MRDNNNSYGLCPSAGNHLGRWNQRSNCAAGCLETLVRTLQWKLLRQNWQHQPSSLPNALPVTATEHGLPLKQVATYPIGFAHLLQ